MKLTLGKLALPALASVVVAPLTLPVPAQAERLANPVAEFSGIDKITGRITTFDVYVNETVQFGALQVTPKVCYSRDETEAQKIDSFVEVDEITLDRKIRRIFSGWMFADSPALNAVEHPIYDVWLTGCKATSDVPAPEGVKATHPAPEPAKAETAQGAATPPPQPTTGAPVAPAAPEMVAPIGGATGAAPMEAPQQVPVTDGQQPAAPGGVPPLDAPTEVPPLDAPQEVPSDLPGAAPADVPYGAGEQIPGGPVPPADVLNDGGQVYPVDPLVPGQQGTTPPAAPPGGVGLY